MLGPGDTLLLASDGFAELLDGQGHQLGYPGVIERFRHASRAATARDVVEQLFVAASEFRGPRAQDDDITFVVIRVVSS